MRAVAFSGMPLKSFDKRLCIDVLIEGICASHDAFVEKMVHFA